MSTERFESMRDWMIDNHPKRVSVEVEMPDGRVVRRDVDYSDYLNEQFAADAAKRRNGLLLARAGADDHREAFSEKARIMSIALRECLIELSKGVAV